MHINNYKIKHRICLTELFLKTWYMYLKVRFYKIFNSDEKKKDEIQ